jgi:hypothetical protein
MAQVALALQWLHGISNAGVLGWRMTGTGLVCVCVLSFTFWLVAGIHRIRVARGSK